MKHLKPDLDIVTNIELKAAPTGDIQAIGVDADKDIVGVPGLIFNPNEGTTIPANCELFGVASYGIDATDNTTLNFDSAISLTIPITAGDELKFFLDTDVVNNLIPEGTAVQFTLIAAEDYAVGATTIKVTDASFAAAAASNVLIALNPQDYTLANCTPALTVTGPGGGDLCVTGNLLLGGALTDKDGNEIISIDEDGDTEIDGDVNVDGDINGGMNNCTPISGSNLIFSYTCCYR